VSSRPLPPEGEKLLAVDPSQFVAERDLLVRKLRSEDRQDEADAVAGLRKPSIVVFAVNRAACDRPKTARAAADAACKVKDAQVGNQPEAFKQGIEELDNALEMLAEVAVAHVAPRGKVPSDTMRRRVRDLLRAAVADEDAREALARGALASELEVIGFSSYAGMAAAPPREQKERAEPSRAAQNDAKRQDRERTLRKDLVDAQERLKETEIAVRDAERKRKAAERAVTSAQAKLDRIDSVAEDHV